MVRFAVSGPILLTLLLATAARGGDGSAAGLDARRAACTEARVALHRDLATRCGARALETEAEERWA